VLVPLRSFNELTLLIRKVLLPIESDELSSEDELVRANSFSYFIKSFSHSYH
jgi:hypothetical protein